MRIKFLTSLEPKYLGMRNGRALWCLSHDFGFSVDGDARIIPAGFKTDFASVPRWPLAYLIAGGVSFEAPLIHDWLYSRNVDRKWADQVFLAAMKEEGVPRKKRTVMYWAVRMFAGRSFNRR